MSFIHTCKHNYILWWYLYLQMNLSVNLMGMRRDHSSLKFPWASCRCPKQQSPTPAMLHFVQNGANALNRDVKIWEQLKALQINTTPPVWMELSTAGWLQGRSMLVPVAIGLATPEMNRTEGAEIKAYSRSESQGWHTTSCFWLHFPP